MTAELVKLPGALHLAITAPVADDTGTPTDLRDDILATEVAYSVTAGFDPVTAPLKFFGEKFMNTIPNLTPLVPHYVRYRHIYTTEQGMGEWSDELTATPNKIDGGLIASFLSGKAIADRGAMVTAYAPPAATLQTTFTLQLETTLDFPAAGAVAVVSARLPFVMFCRYTGVAGNTLTGFSGSRFGIAVGDVVVPLPFASMKVGSVSGGNLLLGLDDATGEIFDYHDFPVGGGSGLLISATRAAATFTFTSANNVSGVPSLQGVAGLANFSNSIYKCDYAVQNPGFSTAAHVAGNTNLTLSAANPSLYSENGGALVLARVGVVGFHLVFYNRIVGTTVECPAGALQSLPTGTYHVIPDYAFYVAGQCSTVVGLGFRNIHKLDSFGLAAAGGKFSRPVSIRSSTPDGEPLLLESEGSRLHISANPLNPLPATPLQGTLGYAYVGGEFRWVYGDAENVMFRKLAHTDELFGLETDFSHANAVQNDFTMAIIGTGALFTTAPVAGALSHNHPGVLQWRSGTTANSGVQCHTLLSHFRIGGGEQWDVNFRTGPVLTTITLRSGAMDSITVTAPVDGVYFEMALNGNIVGKTRSNSVESVTPAIATLAVNTWYHGRIVIDAAATQAKFTVYNDAGVELGEQTVFGNIPKTAGRELGWGSIATSSGVVAIELCHMDRQKFGNPGRVVARGAA